MYSNGTTRSQGTKTGVESDFFSLAKLKPQPRGKGNIVKHGVRMVKEVDPCQQTETERLQTLSLPQQGRLGDCLSLYWTTAGNKLDNVKALKRVDNNRKTLNLDEE